MTTTPETPSDLVGSAVRRYRDLHGWTAQQLADECAEAGAPGITAAVLANIETGRRAKDGQRRRDVTVDEWLVLARALSVPPVLLLLPIGQQDEVKLVPGVSIHPDLARKWVVGEEPAVDSQRRTVGDVGFWQRQATPTRLYGQLNTAQEEMHRAESDVRAAERIGRPEGVAVARERHVAALRRLSDALDAMAVAEISAPALPGAWLDEMAELGLLKFPDRVQRFEE